MILSLSLPSATSAKRHVPYPTFRRAVRQELLSHTALVFSSLLVIWTSILLVRLLGDAAGDRIGADAVFGLVGFSTVNALPTIVVLSLFLGCLATINRSWRDQEMIVWQSAGLGPWAWLVPFGQVLSLGAVLVAGMTLVLSPWAYQQSREYRAQYEQRSDVSKVAPGQFRESGSDDRVFFVESGADAADNALGRVGGVFVRWIEDGRLNVMASQSGQIVVDQGARYLVLQQGERHGLSLSDSADSTSDQLRFERYSVLIEEVPPPPAQLGGRAQSSLSLMQHADAGARAELFYRLSLPVVVLVLGILALSLGAVNPRLGRSGNILAAILLALLYLNLVSLAQARIATGRDSVLEAALYLHGTGLAIALGLIAWRHRRRFVASTSTKKPSP